LGNSKLLKKTGFSNNLLVLIGFKKSIRTFGEDEQFFFTINIIIYY